MTISLSSCRLGNIQSPAGPARIAHATFSGRASQSSSQIQFGQKQKEHGLSDLFLNPLMWFMVSPFLGTLLGALDYQFMWPKRSNPEIGTPQQVEVRPAEETLK